MKTRNRKTRKKHPIKNKKKSRTYTGGCPKTQNCKNIVAPLKKLANYIKTPYCWAIRLYDSTKCHLFIWHKDSVEEYPHIHVHGFSNNTYEYTLTQKTGKKKHTSHTAVLYVDEDTYYESVLVEMYNTLENRNRPIPVLSTPTRRSHNVDGPDTPDKKHIPSDGLRTNELRSSQIKLGPEFKKTLDESYEVGTSQSLI
jgi:hypothetical protein